MGANIADALDEGSAADRPVRRFCFAPAGANLESPMRNAQKAALMALFAAMEENRERDECAPPALALKPEPARPILVDLVALKQRRAGQQPA